MLEICDDDIIISEWFGDWKYIKHAELDGHNYIVRKYLTPVGLHCTVNVYSWGSVICSLIHTPLEDEDDLWLCDLGPLYMEKELTFRLECNMLLEDVQEQYETWLNSEAVIPDELEGSL